MHAEQVRFSLEAGKHSKPFWFFLRLSFLKNLDLLEFVIIIWFCFSREANATATKEVKETKLK